MKTEKEINELVEDIILSKLESDSDGFESFYRYNEVKKGIIEGYKAALKDILFSLEQIKQTKT